MWGWERETREEEEEEVNILKGVGENQLKGSAAPVDTESLPVLRLGHSLSESYKKTVKKHTHTQAHATDASNHLSNTLRRACTQKTDVLKDNGARKTAKKQFNRRWMESQSSPLWFVLKWDSGQKTLTKTQRVIKANTEMSISCFPMKPQWQHSSQSV